MRFPRQEYWSGLPFSFPGIFPTLESTYTCVHAKSLQSCLILCDQMDCSPPGSSVHGILQARMGCHALLWGSSQPRDGTRISQGSNLRLLCLLHWQVGSSPLAPPRKPLRIHTKALFGSAISPWVKWFSFMGKTDWELLKGQNMQLGLYWIICF